MDAPICRTCGKKHWSRVCSGDDVTLPSPKPVTKPVTVTPPVTPIADQREIEALRAEVAMLKRKLAEVNKVPAPAAERMRKMRERRKAIASPSPVPPAASR